MLTKTATIILGIIQKHPVNAYELIKMLSRFQLKDWYDSMILQTPQFMQHLNP